MRTRQTLTRASLRSLASGFAQVQLCEPEGCLVGVIRADGTWLFEPGRFSYVSGASEGLAFVVTHEGWRGYVELDGNPMFEAWDGGDFVNGIAEISRYLEPCLGTEYVDQSGKSIFPFQVTGTPATFDENGVAVVEILHRGASHQEVEARRRRLAAKAARRVRARDGTQQLGGTGQAPNGQELVLHRERGVLWPPGWNEVGGGEPVLCWPELEKQKRAGEGGAQ